TFLYHFEDQEWGAWEHSYSSEYIMKEKDLTPEFAKHISDIASHEFFHIITPLNIHSEIIEQFNFVEPTPSQHLWLYEGTTEWASDMMQLRGGLMDLPAYLQDLTQKLYYDDNMDKNYSILKLALTSYTSEGHKQYGNIYNRGAVAAALLDIRLLELSGGKRGLREVINELSKEYGQKRAFPENEFFDLFTAKTYPEIGDFFNRYIKNAEPLPLADYYSKLGINYTPAIKTGQMVKALGYNFGAPDGKIRVANIHDSLKASGLKEFDEVVAVNGVQLNLQNANQVIGGLQALKPGDVYKFTVNRDGQEQEVSLSIIEKEKVLKHQFSVNEQASPQQVALRNSWMRNL
ncbi:MAG: PDZ domain-containing protein, partial [Pontibacter sp.]|nr:PDZ domain-containing protein [Pontibacter sp.]